MRCDPVSRTENWKPDPPPLRVLSAYCCNQPLHGHLNAAAHRTSVAATAKVTTDQPRNATARVEPLAASLALGMTHAASAVGVLSESPDGPHGQACGRLKRRLVGPVVAAEEGRVAAQDGRHVFCCKTQGSTDKTSAKHVGRDSRTRYSAQPKTSSPRHDGRWASSRQK